VLGQVVGDVMGGREVDRRGAPGQRAGDVLIRPRAVSVDRLAAPVRHLDELGRARAR